MPVLTADEIRQLPFGTGLLLHRNVPGTLVKTPAWKLRADAHEIAAGQERVRGERATGAGAAETGGLDE